MRVVRTIDLSVAIEANTVVYPGDPTVQIAPACTIENDGCNVLDLQIGSQTGTHVDAPFHFEADAQRIDELDPSLFMGPAVVVNATAAHARAPIGWEYFEPVRARLQPGTIVLLHTGWSQFYGSAEYFNHPYLDASACEKLLETGIRAIMLDAINLDETPDASHPGVGYPCHHLIANAGGVIAENLTNLDLVDWSDPFVMALPIRLASADGAPVRAVAVEFGP